LSEGARLVKSIQKIASIPSSQITDIISGQVTSISPLKIRVDKLILTETFLMLGALAIEKKTIVTIPAIPPDHPLKIDIEVVLWRGLRIGDVVHMLKCAKGQKYFILQRQEGVT